MIGDDINDVKNCQSYKFDRVFDQNATQQDVFDECQEYLDQFLQGKNVSIITYGATLSGKTYSICGENFRSETRGIIPRAVEYIYSYLKQLDKDSYSLKMSFLEVYLEKVRDLLDADKKNLQVIDADEAVPDLTVIKISSKKEIFQIIELANALKVVASNKVNLQSSRSHTILTLYLQRKISDTEYVNSKLLFCDCCGSEKLSQTESVGLRRDEACNINKGLLALGQVINNLTSPNQHKYINYRDSKLTRILKSSLGGNSKTMILVHLAPCSNSYAENLNTILFAQRAQTVKNVVRTNITSNIDSGLAVQHLLTARQVIQQLASGHQLTEIQNQVYNSEQTNEQFLHDLFKIDPSIIATQDGKIANIQRQSQQSDQVLLSPESNKQQIQQYSNQSFTNVTTPQISIDQSLDLQTKLLLINQDQIKQYIKEDEIHQNSSMINILIRLQRIDLIIPICDMFPQTLRVDENNGDYPQELLLKSLHYVTDNNKLKLYYQTLLYILHNFSKYNQADYLIELLIQQQVRFEIKQQILQLLLKQLEPSVEILYNSIQFCIDHEQYGILLMISDYIFETGMQNDVINQMLDTFVCDIVTMNNIEVVQQILQNNHLLQIVKQSQILVYSMLYTSKDIFKLISKSYCKITKSLIIQILMECKSDYIIILLSQIYKNINTEVDLDTLLTLIISQKQWNLLKQILIMTRCKLDAETFDLIKQISGNDMDLQNQLQNLILD